MTILLTVMGMYYAVTGIWPILRMPSFEAVTGPKRDRWLVRMVGLLAFSTGVVFLFSVASGRALSPEVLLLAVLNILSFMIIDIYYVMKKVISVVYLGDALVQGVYLLFLSYLSVGK